MSTSRRQKQVDNFKEIRLNLKTLFSADSLLLCLFLQSSKVTLYLSVLGDPSTFVIYEISKYSKTAIPMSRQPFFLHLNTSSNLRTYHYMKQQLLLYIKKILIFKLTKLRMHKDSTSACTSKLLLVEPRRNAFTQIRKQVGRTLINVFSLNFLSFSFFSLIFLCSAIIYKTNAKFIRVLAVTLDQSSLSDSVPDLQQSDQRYRDEQSWRKKSSVLYQQRLSRKYHIKSIYENEDATVKGYATVNFLCLCLNCN